MPTDEILIDAFRTGDEEGFRELVRRHRQMVYRLAWRTTGNHADADDLVQDVFLRVYRSLPSFRGEATFRTWLFRIVLNRLSTWRRAAARAVAAVSLEREPAAPATPEDPATEGVDAGQLRRAVDLLPDRQRETVVLRFFQGLKYREIAAVLGCSEGTAKANVHHAVRALRARLGDAERKRGTETVLDLS